jgi:hypothetical protein
MDIFEISSFSYKVADFYLPTSRMAFRQLPQEKELVCDDLAVCATRRPLVFASALTKVWLHRIDTSPYARVGGVQSLVSPSTLTDHRIKRLLDVPSPIKAQSSRFCVLGTAILMMLALVLAQVINTILVHAVTGCNLVAILEKIF